MWVEARIPEDLSRQFKDSDGILYCRPDLRLNLRFVFMYVDCLYPESSPQEQRLGEKLSTNFEDLWRGSHLLGLDLSSHAFLSSSFSMHLSLS